MAKQTGHAEFIRWIPLLLDALRKLGGSAEARETYDLIADAVKLPIEERERRNKSGNVRFQNQVQWARQYLVWAGLIDGSRRGIWTLTPEGAKTHLTEEQSRQIVQRWVKIQYEAREPKLKQTEIIPTVQGEIEVRTPEEAEEHELLEVLQSLSADGFERLCKRLLHEYGLERVVVTGKSHDGGLDGTGILRLNPFVTMKVLFQCKKIRSSVSRAQVGDFRNAVLGRAEKGIFITTGWFSPDAEKEANRDGVIPIEMVDGERLVELFEAKQLGLRRKEVFEVDHSFFDQFR